MLRVNENYFFFLTALTKLSKETLKVVSTPVHSHFVFELFSSGSVLLIALFLVSQCGLFFPPLLGTSINHVLPSDIIEC